MAMSDVRAKELAEIEPPRSMNRLIKLFDELSRDPALSSGASESSGIASNAVRALSFSRRIQASSPFAGQSKSDLVGYLMDRHSISAAEVQDFSAWLVKWNDKRSQMEVLRAPEMFLGQKAVSEPTPIESLSGLARRRQPLPEPRERVVVKEVVVEKVRDREVIKEVRGPKTTEVRVVENTPSVTSTSKPQADTLSKAWTRGRGSAAPDPSGVPGQALAPALSQGPAAPVDMGQLIGGGSRSLWTGNLQGGNMVSGLYYGQSSVATPGAYAPVVAQAPPVVAAPAAQPVAQAMGSPAMQQAAPALAQPGSFAADPASQLLQRGMPGGAQPAPLAAARPMLSAAGPLMAVSAGAAASNLVHRNLFIVPNAPAAPVLSPAEAAAAGVLGPLKRGQKPPVEAVNPLMGQITLVSPPVKVASEQAERSGAAVSFDWKTLAAGSGEVDAGGLARLKSVLPPGAHAIYPALPQGSLGPQAANLRLAPSLLSNLLEQGYGPNAVGIAPMAASMATGFAGGKAPAAPLSASLIPDKRPMGDPMGVVSSQPKSGAKGALADAGSGQATRGSALDFLGMPVRLAPSLGGRSELGEEVALRSGQSTLPSGDAIRPQQFAPLRDKLFPSFGSVQAEPDKASWQKAAPSFGLRDDKPTTILSPDARVKPLKPGADEPQMDVLGGKGAKALSVTPLENMRTPSLADAGGAGPSLQMAKAAGDGLDMPLSSTPGGMGSLGLGAATALPQAARAAASALETVGGVGPGSIGSLSSVGGASMPGLPSMPMASAPGGAGPSFTLGGSVPATPSVNVESASMPSLGPRAGSSMPPTVVKPFTPAATSGTGTLRPRSLPALPSATPAAPAGPPATPGMTVSHSIGGPAPTPPAAPSFSGIGAARSPSSFSRPSSPGLGSTGPSVVHVGSTPSPAPDIEYSTPSLGMPASPGSASGPTPVTRQISSIASKAPPRLFAPPPSGPSKSMAVQKAVHIGGLDPQVEVDRGGNTNTQVGPDDEDGTAQVHLLAGEVWAILRRRLSIERDRSGRW